MLSVPVLCVACLFALHLKDQNLSACFDTHLSVTADITLSALLCCTTCL